MSPAGNDPGGIPRGTRRVALPPRSAPEENWSGANSDKADKLRRNSLRRLARTRGLELRHTSYGYALIDAERKRVDDRNDLTLDEVESRLSQG